MPKASERPTPTTRDATPPIHGTVADRFVPVVMGQFLLAAIPTAERHFYLDLGHLGTIVENDATILDWLRQ